MVKHKPKLFKKTGELIKAGHTQAAIFVGALEILPTLVGISSGTVTYNCGNPRCNGLIAISSNAKRPVVCKKCGEEIDWVGIETRIAKVCPTCNKELAEEDNFCPYHVPKVELIKKGSTP